jgi:hypothetical protein
MKTRSPSPDWFSLKNYALHELKDARSWRDALLRANARLDPNWHDKEEEWRRIIGPEIDNMYPAYPHPPPVVQLIEESRTLHPNELPALLISLNAPDDVIREHFETALRAARERHPSHVRKPGPKALNARFGEQQFYTWWRYKILPLAALLAWRTRQKDKISDVQLGLWLGFDEDRAAKEIELAKKALQGALDSIPALAAQVAAEHKLEAAEREEK